MCIILDTNKYSDFLDLNNKDMEAIRHWIEKKKGKIAWSPTEKLKQELETHGKMKKQFKVYRQAGLIKNIDNRKVNDEKKKLLNQKDSEALKSDDPDIIALAITAQVKVLVSEDRNLCDDFKKIIPGGKIYTRKRDNQHLLQPDMCP